MTRSFLSLVAHLKEFGPHVNCLNEVVSKKLSFSRWGAPLIVKVAHFQIGYHVPAHWTFVQPKTTRVR
jgi:hypothetical protein